jgi:hypothetical protein
MRRKHAMTRLHFAMAAAALICTGCVSAPQRVREQAGSDLRCTSSQVVVNRTQAGGYFRDDRYEAEGCGRRAAYECEKVYVLMIPAGTMGCSRESQADPDSQSPG